MLAHLIANAVSEALGWTATIADVMKVDCQTVLELFIEAFVNNAEGV